MNHARTTMVWMVSLALLASCSDASKAPAEAAMAAAGTAMDSLKGDAAKYAPEAVKSLESSYGTARDFMANKDYRGVLTFAKDIPTKAKEVLAKVDAAKAALAREWTDASGAMTATVGDAKQRLDVLSRAKRLPAGMDKATLSKARTDLASLEADWARVTEQYKAGDWSGAVARAKDLNGKGLALLGTLEVK
jgi:hypothetical protein